MCKKNNYKACKFKRYRQFMNFVNGSNFLVIYDFYDNKINCTYTNSWIFHLVAFPLWILVAKIKLLNNISPNMAENQIQEYDKGTNIYLMILKFH